MQPPREKPRQRFRINSTWRTYCPLSFGAVMAITKSLEGRIADAFESHDWAFVFDRDYGILRDPLECDSTPRTFVRGISLQVETDGSLASLVEVFSIAFRIWTAFLPQEISIERCDDDARLFRD